MSAKRKKQSSPRKGDPHATGPRNGEPSRALHLQFGAEVRKVRAELGMSLETLAKLSGLTPNYIGKLERGLVNPALSTITLIAAGLGETLGGLLGNAQHLSPSAVRMARLLDQAPPQVRRGVIALLRGAAQAKKKTPDSEP